MIWNITTNKIISRKHKLCNTFLTQAIGLMFSKPRTAVFELNKQRKLSIHTVFMRFPLDLIYVRNNKVVEIKENLKPFWFYHPKNKADTLIECPAGIIKQTKTKLRNKVQIKT